MHTIVVALAGLFCGLLGIVCVASMLWLIGHVLYVKYFWMPPKKNLRK